MSRYIVLITQDVGDLHTNPYIDPQITSYILWTLLQRTTFLKCFMFSSLLHSYIFCHIQCAKTALQKLVKSEALKVTVYRVYTDWHMLILINSQVFVSFFSSFFFSLTPLHLRILYFPNAIKCIFFLKPINRFFASNIYNSGIFQQLWIDIIFWYIYQINV